MHSLKIGLFFFLSVIFFSCKTTKKINKVIEPKEVVDVQLSKETIDSISFVHETYEQFRSSRIQFKTFNGKIKVESSGNSGKNPDITAVVKIIHDSAIWMSLSATILNYEVYRVLITKDSVILMNKKDKEVLYRSIDFLQEVTQIPFDYNTLEDIIVGNPIFMGDSVLAFKKSSDVLLMTTLDANFKNLFTINPVTNLMLHSKMDDIDNQRSRTADFTYSAYDTTGSVKFSTERQILASEKNKIEVNMNFKQFEFDKNITISFNVPKNYIRK
jgi:hypothetical protein